MAYAGSMTPAERHLLLTTAKLLVHAGREGGLTAEQVGDLRGCIYEAEIETEVQRRGRFFGWIGTKAS